jgi:SM-20-related protein
METEPTCAYEIERNQIFVYDSLLTANDVEAMHHALLKADVSILGCSNDETTESKEVMFELDIHDFRTHRLNLVIMACIESITGMSTFVCNKILGNFVRFGSNTFIHQDAHNPNVLSALYFVNSRWHPDWGGELVFFDSSRNVECCVSPRPGRLVVFPAGIFHRAGVPTRPCTETRITLSARYCPNDVANKALQATSLRAMSDL